MPDTTAPYRADEVGSLLRTAAAQGGARQAREGSRSRPTQLKAVEDEEIKKIIRKQEEVGLQLATDGEFRRSWWHFDFFRDLKGVEIYDAEQGIQFKGIQTKPQAPARDRQAGFSGRPSRCSSTSSSSRPTPRSRRR